MKTHYTQAAFDQAHTDDSCKLRKKFNRSLRSHRNYRNLSWVFGVCLGIFITLYVFALQNGAEYKDMHANEFAATTLAKQKIADLEQKLTDANTASAAKIQELSSAKATAEASADSAVKAQIAADAAKAKAELEAQQAKNLQAIAEKALAESDKEKANLMQQLAIANTRPAKEAVVLQEVPRATPVDTPLTTGLPINVVTDRRKPNGFPASVAKSDTGVIQGLRRIARQTKDTRAQVALNAAADALEKGATLKDVHDLIIVGQGMAKAGLNHDAALVEDALRQFRTSLN